MTDIKRMREKDIERLAELTGSEETARKIMNSFYRLAGLEIRLLELENDAEFYERHRRYLDRENDRSLEWVKRLNKMLEGTGLSVFVSGGYPKIVRRDTEKTGNAIAEVFTYGHYYR